VTQCNNTLRTTLSGTAATRRKTATVIQGGTSREEDVNQLICIRGSASPGHSYPMTPLYVKNTGGFPDGGLVLGQSGVCDVVAEGFPGRNPPRGICQHPADPGGPPNVGPGEDYMILTAEGDPPSTSGSGRGPRSSRVRRSRI